MLKFRHNFSSMQTNGFIQFLNVEVLKNQISVLKDITFNIPKGDFVYIIDPIGQSKTSLIQTIYGQLSIHNGHATIADIPIHNIDQQAIPYLRRQLGLISLAFPLNKQLSVKKNLQLVLSATNWTDLNAQENRIDYILDYLEISELKTKSIRELTAVQYLLVLVARALLNNPSVLLLDNPLQQIDSTTGAYLLNKLYGYAQNNSTTVLWATMNQDITNWQNADKVLACHGDNIIEID